MRKLLRRDRWRRLCVVLAVLAIAAAAALAVSPPAAALECDGVALDDGCLFTITGGDTPDPDDGYAVTNADGVPLYDFVRERDLNAIGYPISQRWVNGPFTFQAFQKVILQWDPGKGRMNYYNTLDVLANRHPEVELPNVPPHQVLEADRGASFATIIRNHLALLDQNAAIKDRFLSEPDWLNLYGLPISYEEREVNGHPQGLQMLRAQRTVFVIWNVPAPGTTVGRVNLQNVPDKVKRLSNVIIPDGAKAVRTEANLNHPAIIASLYWVADGVSPLDQMAITYLQRVLALSEPLLRAVVEDPNDAFFRNQPTQPKLAGYRALAAIAELPWAQDGLSPSEHYLVRLLYIEAVNWPDVIPLLLQKPWLRDGVTHDEYEVIDGVISIAQSNQKFTPGGQSMANRILSMPFLDSIEPFDAPAVNSLRRIGMRGRDDLYRVVAHPSIPHGITDHYANIVAILWYATREDPSQLDLLFDTSKTWIETRSIVLPHTGPTFLAVIRSQPGEPVTMTYLEGAVRSVEEAMQRPFPTNYIALHVSEVVDPWGGLFVGSHIAIREGYDNREHYFHDGLRPVLHHEVAHYYWHSCPSWICEGAAVFLEIRTGVLGSGRIKALQDRCKDTRILEISSGWHECHYFIGALMFHNLFWSLGEDLFLRGFWRLHDAGQGRLSPGNCDGMEIGLCHLRFAFVTDAPPDAAALAERFIRVLYFGEEDTGA